MFQLCTHHLEKLKNLKEKTYLDVHIDIIIQIFEIIPDTNEVLIKTLLKKCGTYILRYVLEHSKMKMDGSLIFYKS